MVFLILEAMISLTWMYHARQLNGNTYTITGIPTISVRGSSCAVTKANTFLFRAV